ncbi:hypothetical protein, partial [Actinomadura rubrisoli]|uniref:hypothetical protein n=1 Tax=Actinomadura rubrisoli TaxID=2530368 RepID=UPI001A9FC641
MHPVGRPQRVVGREAAPGVGRPGGRRTNGRRIDGQRIDGRRIDGRRIDGRISGRISGRIDRPAGHGSARHVDVAGIGTRARPRGGVLGLRGEG